MGFFSFLLLGLIAGALAKLILPGKQGGGWILTLLLGLVGSFVGSLVATLLRLEPYRSFWNPVSWIFAIGGSIVVLLIFGWIQNRRKASASAR